MTPWEKFRKDWQGKRVLIMGLGLLGRGVGDAKVFAEAGAQVTVTDLKREEELRPSLEKLRGFKIRFVLGQHEEKDFRSHHLILRNPAVPQHSQFLAIAREAGIPIKMDSSLFAVYNDQPVIGVTGTRGKTTTTMMIYEILKKVKKGQSLKGQSFLGGNVPGKATLELLKNVSQGIIVLELSSWELQGWHDEKLSPHIGVFTNFYQDHLNRYSSMNEYFKDKLALARYQTKDDWLVVNQEDKWIRKMIGQTDKQLNRPSDNPWGKGKLCFFSSRDLPEDFELPVPGEHNRANAAAALKTAEILGVEKRQALKVLAEFKGVHSRLETIATVDGVEYINDTTSTTPTAGVAALRAMTKPVVLIAGGASKQLDMKPYASQIVKTVKHLILLKGEGTEELLAEVEKSRKKYQQVEKREKTRIYDDLKKAVEAARAASEPGDVVLLSPGCASFSMFKNEFDRGEQFNRLVERLIGF